MSRADNREHEPSAEVEPFVWTAKHTVVLAVLCAAQVLDGIDVTVVNVALPSIGHQLGFSPDTLSWIVNAYMVTFGGFLLLGGRAGDLLGRRKVFLGGLALFVVTSLVAGLTRDAGLLVGARAVQGLAAALIAPMTLALIASHFPVGKGRDRAFVLWGAAYGLSSALGLVLGGLLVNGPGWRWIFLINVPIAAVLFVAALRNLRPDRPARRHQRFDFVGAVTSTAGVGLLAYGVLSASTGGWGSARTVVVLIAAVLLLSYFVVHETRIAREPLVTFSLFRERSLAGANIVTALRGAAMFALFYFATLYQQQVLGYSALKTGLAYLPLTLILVVASGVGPMLVQRIGIRFVLFGGALVAAAGLLWFTQITPDGSLMWSVIAPSVVVALGFAIMVVPSTVAALTGVPQAHTGIASAMLNVSLQVGGALGLAALSTVATSKTAGRAGSEALVDGFVFAFIAAAALMVVTAIVALFLFREDGRGGKVDVIALQKAELDS
ncbi:MFS transporter [Amycolatopsis saalfeldensis]|uniref:Drug resistance transporter, EmrB/QacA subfamily n=1 Tax=Amycolatopsis saalfeldensis TaxID=394193 RepID=A0A1H8YNE4_9PSEU|nr:MFS transporter [Amycolatopsis saalfeldensis]SEP53562.1 drug resistance transporter, EmrB/QacA subfamily [Amycolatopsis saalfeldensis]